MKSNYSCFVLLPPKKLTGSQANKKQSNAIIQISLLLSNQKGNFPKRFWRKLYPT